jgi:hypothetical protein
MSGPTFRFDDEEFTLEIRDLGGGWSFGQLGELRILDEATLQFPSSLSEFEVGVAMQVIEMQWRFNARLVLEQTLDADVSFTGADGAGMSLDMNNELKLHILDRPTTSLDVALQFRLRGETDGSTFEGSGTIGVGATLHF